MTFAQASLACPPEQHAKEFVMRRLLISAGIAAGFLGLAGTAHGHGGQYRGPGDMIPPNLGGTGDTSPPGNAGPGSGPGSAPPTTGRPGITTGSGPAVPGATSGRAPGGRTGGQGVRHAGGEGFEQWEFWWEYNKEPYLDLRMRLGEMIKTGTSAVGVGRGDRAGGISTNRVTAEDVKNEILPALIPALSEADADIVDSSVLAIGRMLPRDLSDLGFDAIVRTLKSEHTSAQEAATLSLGVLGDPKAIEILVELMNDTPKARSQYLQSNKPTPNLVRAFAALSLGMIGQKDSIPLLERVIEKEADGQKDLKSCALLALGMFKSDQEAIIAFLMKVMENRDLDRMLRAYAPTSIAKLGEAATAAVPQFLAMAKSDKTDNDMVRSSVIALGKLSTVKQKDVIDTLKALALDHSDMQTRHFAYIALAEIGARDRSFETSAEAHQGLTSFFLEALSRPKPQTSLPWAGLGLAIYARSQQALQVQAIPKLHQAFEDSNNPSYKAAMAIGLGLVEASRQRRAPDPGAEGVERSVAQGIHRRVARPHAREHGGGDAARQHQAERDRLALPPQSGARARPHERSGRGADAGGRAGEREDALGVVVDRAGARADRRSARRSSRSRRSSPTSRCRGSSARSRRSRSVCSPRRPICRGMPRSRSGSTTARRPRRSPRSRHPLTARPDPTKQPLLERLSFFHPTSGALVAAEKVENLTARVVTTEAMSEVTPLRPFMRRGDGSWNASHENAARRRLAGEFWPCRTRPRRTVPRPRRRRLAEFWRRRRHEPRPRATALRQTGRSNRPSRGRDWRRARTGAPGSRAATGGGFPAPGSAGGGASRGRTSAA
jgi:HEAT repeat protein